MNLKYLFIVIFALCISTQAEEDSIDTLPDTVRQVVTIYDTVRVVTPLQLPQPLIISTDDSTNWVDIIAQLLVFLGILVVLYQIQRNDKIARLQIQSNQATALEQAQQSYESNIAAQRELLREEQKILVYRELITGIKSYQSAIGELYIALLTFCNPLRMYMEFGFGGPLKTSMEFFNICQNARPNDVSSVMENNEIICHRLEGMRVRIVELGREIHNEFSRDFYPTVYSYLVNELIPEEVTAKASRGLRELRANPSAAAIIDNIEVRASDLREKTSTMQSFLFDLRVEAQNELLGELFEKKARRRNPADPSFEVLTIENTAHVWDDIESNNQTPKE